MHGSSLSLKNMLHVPNLSCNLLSVSKITKDLNCFVTHPSINPSREQKNICNKVLILNVSYII